MAEDSEKPKEQEKEEEDPKTIAKTMLIDGYQRASIVEEIQEVTGLPKRTIWALKGSLARTGDIPTKSQLKRMEREKPGPEALEFKTEAEGVPFRRPRPPHVLIEAILTQFGVKERAKDIIISRCKRAGGMHPSELDRSLMDLDTGVNRKEASYVTEEYYLALQAEEDAARQAEGRSWPMRRREPGGAGRYPLREDQPTGREYERSLYGRPGDRHDSGREGSLTRREFTDILERERRNWEEQARREREQETMGQLREDIGVMATELRNLKENPPVQPAPTGPSDYEKSLEHTIDRQDKRQEELMTLIKEERSETKDDMKEIRETYEVRLDKQQEEFRAEIDKRGTPHDTSGYRDDSVRLAAEGLHEIADVARARGSPFRIIVEGLPRLMGDEGRPPQRERGRPASVADLVGPEYVEG